MYSPQELCSRIEKIFPEIGACGINLDVTFDEKNNAWLVDLKKNNHELKTYIDLDEAQNCMDNKKCVSLALQISQLRANIDSMDEEMPHKL